MKELQQAVARPDVARRVGVLPKKTVNLDKVLDPSKRRIKEVRNAHDAADANAHDLRTSCALSCSTCAARATVYRPSRCRCARCMSSVA